MLFAEDYTNRKVERFNFSPSEWEGLVVAGNVAAGISFAANSIVLILHAFMLWYKPAIVNRLSLRMIVLSCIFNMLYCSCQLVTDDIPSTSVSCRALAYILVASDTMACMCLAMVGLNLVMIFVLKVSRSLKLEMFYYFIVAISGVLVVVIPLVFGTKKGPRDSGEVASCWYHYYFDGRMNQIFNWMWYYGWLLFSLVFAAICAVISIRFVVKKQENFAGTLDMFTRRNRAEISTINILKNYSKNNTDVFQKIARRCVCYPLVPFFSKSWGVAIEIAASQQASIPYPIFVLDRLFSCLLGFMVSCIYFTDPAIGAVFKESRDLLKKKYVYDYYCIKYQPGSDPTVQPKSQYPQLVKVVPSIRSHTSPAFSPNHMRSMYLEEDVGPTTTVGSESIFSSHQGDPLDMRHLHPHMSSSYASPSQHKPEVPTLQVHKARGESIGESSTTKSCHRRQSDRRYSVISVTSMSGRTFLPNEVLSDNVSEGTTKCLSVFKKSNVTSIPMRRVSNTSTTVKESSVSIHHHHAYPKHTETVEILVPFKFPKVAKIIHWTLVSVFKVTPMKRRDSEDDDDNDDEFMYNKKSKKGGTVFRDYTDASDPGTPPQQLSGAQGSSYGSPSSTKSPGFTQRDPISVFFEDSDSDFPADRRRGDNKKRFTKAGSDAGLRLSPLSKPRAKSIDAKINEEPVKEFPMRRVSTINVGSLQWSRIKKPTFASSRLRPMNLERRPSSSISGSSKFASSLGLTKMLNRGRSMSFSWGKRTHTAKKSSLSNTQEIMSPTVTEPSSELAGSPILKDDTITELKDLTSPSSGSIHSKIKIGEPIDKQAFLDEYSGGEEEGESSSGPVAVSSGLLMTSPFPMELSPRPISQYKKQSLNKRVNKRQGSSSADAFMPTPIRRARSSRSKPDKSSSEKLKNKLSIFADDDDDDDNFYSLMELFDGQKNVYIDEEEGSPTADDIIQPSFTITPREEVRLATLEQEQLAATIIESPEFEEEKEKLPVEVMCESGDHHQEGLVEGLTSIDYISSWQETESAEASRITVYSEPWDIVEQFKKQMELEEQIAHI